MTITKNAVRDGGVPSLNPPLSESNTTSKDPRPDHNYQRIKRFRDAALRREQNCTGGIAEAALIERLLCDTILEGWRW